MSFSIDVQMLQERASKRASTPATVATLLPDEGSKVARVAGLQRTADAAPDADRWCWPHGAAMNSAELAALAARRDRLMRWGWSADDAEALADRLTLNARDTQDDRRSCVDCRNGRSRRCPDGAPLPGNVIHRCGGFAERSP